MSEIRNILADTTRRILAEGTGVAVTAELEDGRFPDRLWARLAESGLPALQPGGDEGSPDLSDAMSVVRLAGYYAAPVPLAETLLANWLLASVGRPALDGPATVAPVFGHDRLTLTREGDGWALQGVATAVPFARFCAEVVVLAESADGPMLAVATTASAGIAPGRSIAGEPRDTLTFDAAPVAAGAALPCPPGLTAEALLMRGALVRCCGMAGAIARVLDLSARYARERVQFGKPIGKFQAVQQMMSQLASASAAATAASEAATAAVERGAGLFDVAAAKARIGEAATAAAAIGHQVHGAMGFAREHELHLSTRLLWCWREEFGSEAYWQELVGRTAIAAGGADLWPLIIRPDDAGVRMPRDMVW